MEKELSIDPEAVNPMSINTAPIEQMIEKISADSVFGTAIQHGDTVVIPVAQARFGFGYGGGGGKSRKPEASGSEEDAGVAEGNGGGGGAGGAMNPLGYIHISPTEVKFEPVVDATRIPLAGILMAAWAVFWTMATIRSVAKIFRRRREAKT